MNTHPTARGAAVATAVLEVLPRLDRLDVVQVMSAGTDWIEDRVPATTTLCNARGARDAPVAEWILGALLGASTWVRGEELVNVVRRP